MNSFKNINIDLPKVVQIGVLDDNNLASLIEFKRETNRIDYKETLLYFDNKSIHELCKDISSFSNIGGGYMVIGVNNDKIPIGIDKNVEKNLDPTKLSQTISKYISPSIELHTFIGDYKYKGSSLRIGLIFVPEFEKRPHFINNSYSYKDSSTGKEVCNLHRGTIYVRQHAASKPIDGDSWEELLERFYLKNGKLKKKEFDYHESENVFDLGREDFFDKIYKELEKNE